MNRILEDIPSFPKVASIAPLHLGITTRVLAQKLALEREKFKDLEKNSPENGQLRYKIERRRQSSRFLQGASIPNSVIKADLETPEPPIKDKACIRKERDEFVKKMTNRLQPRTNMYHSIYDEDVDREALNTIKKELQRRSLLPLARDKEEDKKSITNTASTYSRSVNKADPWEELKEKRRISRRTSILAPLDGGRRSTYESIKKAIDNSKIRQQLLDADNIEEENIKQIQTEKSAIPSTEFKESVAEKLSHIQERLALEGSSSNIKVVKKEEGGETKNSKRRSLRSEKSLNLPNSERPYIKMKSSSESRRFSKRSQGKLLKEELGKQSSLITNVLQQTRKAN